MTDDVDRAKLQAAYAQFCSTASPQERAAVDRILQSAHHQANDVLAGARSSVDHPGFATAWSDIEPSAVPLPGQGGGAMPEFALPARVDGQGLIWGIGRYTQLDPKWSEALISFFRYRNDRADFGASPQTITIANQTTFAIAGDWGTGFWTDDTPAARVAEQMRRLQPRYTIHLGDVYYAGSEAQETEFVAEWPKGLDGSFTLNSNHEMYSGGRTYFEIALASTGPFAAQRGTSYFALVNDHWLMIALDTSFFSPAANLYMDGTIDVTQRNFLHDTRAQYPNQKLILVSHNEGFDLKGERTNGLWAQIKDALGQLPDYWYWGHAHNAVVYKPRDGCRARCIGHGGVPYGVAGDLAGAPAIDWYETTSVPDDDLPRVLNGFLSLRLDGATLTEALIGEDGSRRWPA